MAVIGRACADQANALRALRLRALAESPDAFGATYSQEAEYSDQMWKLRIAKAAWFVARVSGEPIGMAAGACDDRDDSARHIVSVWVAPEHRGHGCADALIESVCGWAESEGADLLKLWVTEGNCRARRFYRRLGFAETGERQPLPSNPVLDEMRMQRSLK